MVRNISRVKILAGLRGGGGVGVDILVVGVVPLTDMARSWAGSVVPLAFAALEELLELLPALMGVGGSNINKGC